MSSSQAISKQNQILPNLVNTTLPIPVTVQDNTLGQPESQNIDQSQRSQSDKEPLLDINGPSSSPSQPIQLNQIVEDLPPSLDKMEDQDQQKVAQIHSPEELKAIEVQKAIEKKQKAREKMKPFFDDFHKAEDYFVDIVPQKEKIESKIKVLSYRSWYVEGDYIFTIEPNDWKKEKERSFYDSEQTQHSLELFFTSKIEGQEYKTTENNLLRTRLLVIKMNNTAPLEQYKNLLEFCYLLENTETVMFRLVKLKDDVYKEHGIEKLDIRGIYIQPFSTVIIVANYKVYTIDYNEKQAVLKENFESIMFTLNYKSKHILY
eukprot:403345250